MSGDPFENVQSSRSLRFALGALFLSLPMAQTFPVAGISVADFALAVVGAIITASCLREHRWPQRPAWLLPVGVLVGWSLLGFAYLASAAELPFSRIEFVKSLTKLCFYALGAVVVADAVKHVGPKTWGRLLLGALTVHALVGFYVYVAEQGIWGLPYRFLWAGSQGGELAARTLSLSDPFLRMRGVAAEPSYLGFYLAVGLAAVWLASPSHNVGWRDACVALAVAMTLSFSVFAFVAITAPVLAVRRSWRRRDALVMAAGLAVVLLMFIWPPVRASFRIGLLERLAGIVEGSISRGNLLRLNGSYSAAWLMVRESPIFGVGLGNFDVAIAGILDRVDPSLGMKVGHQGWSVPAYLLGTLGWPGIACFLALLALAWRNEQPSAWVLLAAATADGTFLGATFWVFLLLLFETARQQRLNVD